jgi:hypothetical protein
MLPMLLGLRPDQTYARWIVQARGLLIYVGYVVALDRGLVPTCGSYIKVVDMQVKAFCCFCDGVHGKRGSAYL